MVSERIEAAREALVMFLADQMDAAHWLPDGERAGREAESWPVLTNFESAVRESYAPLVAAARQWLDFSSLDINDYDEKYGPGWRELGADERLRVALRAALVAVDGEFEGAGDRG